MVNNKIVLAGDEEWQIPEKINASSFFHGWFEHNKGKKLLEAGCGNGYYVIQFAKLGYNVTGIDISAERVKDAQNKCKKYHIKARFSEGDIRKMPFENASFDTIFCHGVIEHFKNSEAAIKEGYRILKKNGIAMYSVPCRVSLFVPLKMLQKVIDKIFGTRLWRWGYEKSFTPWKFKRMLKQEGFVIREFLIEEISRGHRLPIVSKFIRIIDKPFWKMGVGGKFMCALCEKI